MLCEEERGVKLEKLFPNKSFDRLDSSVAGHHLFLYLKQRAILSYFVARQKEQKKLPACRIFHVNVPLIEIYDISTLVLYIFIIFYYDDIFFITHAHLILSFIFRSNIAAAPYTKVPVDR